MIRVNGTAMHELQEVEHRDQKWQNDSVTDIYASSIICIKILVKSDAPAAEDALRLVPLKLIFVKLLKMSAL